MKQEKESTPPVSSYAPYINTPVSTKREIQHSPTPSIKQESPDPTPDGKIKEESSESAHATSLRSLLFDKARLCADLNDDVNACMQRVESQGDSTPEIITLGTTPEPEDIDESMPDSKSAQPLIAAEILRYYGPTTKRLLLFDYDGTLTDIVTDPDKAVLSPAILFSIRTLAEEPKNAVWIISGRDQGFLTKQFAQASTMGLVAEHGAFIRYPGTDAWLNLTEGVDMSWRNEFSVVCEKALKRAPGSRIERKRAAVVWHYREAEPQDGAREARKLMLRLKSAFASKEQVEITKGKCVVEARLSFINKGAIVQRLLTEFKIQKGEFPDFTLCIGDDVTDEGTFFGSLRYDSSRLTTPDMFRTLNNAHSDVDPENMFAVTVGRERLPVTNAAWYLLEPRNVIENIMMLNQADLTNDIAGDGLLMSDGITHRGSNPLPVPRSYLL